MQNTDLQEYFKDRLIEIFHKNTLDSYRVRTHNVVSLLKELNEVIIGWTSNRIKQFDTIKLCIEEVNSAIKNDTCLDFNFYDKDLFIYQLNDYAKTGEKLNSAANKVIYLINTCIKHNTDKYLNNLILAIESALFTDQEIDDSSFIPTIQKLDNNISALCCELIHMQFSKKYLFLFAKRFKKSSSEFQSIFGEFKSEILLNKQKEFTVIFNLHIFNKDIPNIAVTELHKQIPPELLIKHIQNRYSKFINEGKSKFFYIQQIQATDSAAAAAICKERLNTFLDVLHLGMSRLNIDINDTILVLEKKDNSYFVSQENYNQTLDGIFSNDLSLSTKLRSDIESIHDNQAIKQDVKDRLNSAIRHLRIGNTNVEIEQQFINYWIALEYIFSSPEANENTFTRLKINLINILSCCYAKRNLLDLNEQLIQAGLIDSGTSYWEKGDVNHFIDNQTFVFLRYRLKKMKARLFNKSVDRKEYISNHETNLQHQIARIYRMRNELIHEAAIKQDIENVTSNLRYYLVFLLNQLLAFFSNINHERDKQTSIDDFFYYFAFNKQLIEKEHKLDVILNIPVEMDLLK